MSKLSYAVRNTHNLEPYYGIGIRIIVHCHNVIRHFFASFLASIFQISPSISNHFNAVKCLSLDCTLKIEKRTLIFVCSFDLFIGAYAQTTWYNRNSASIGFTSFSIKFSKESTMNAIEKRKMSSLMKTCRKLPLLAIFIQYGCLWKH